jgi:glycosyltransferase involved in cell wall biosynthesis
LAKKEIRIVVTVISDLVTDQRVHKVCSSLNNAGYKVFLIGAKRKHSLHLSQRNYRAKRIHLIFQKKFGFYAEFNIRLFFTLLFMKADIFLGNDLDVMPATFLAAKLKRKALVYDTHEYYMGMPELEGKRLIKKIWLRIEQFIFPRVSYVYTICESFCALYYKDYHKKLWYIYNVPFLKKQESRNYADMKQSLEQKIPPNKFILLFQGAGINPERGVEELVLSMCYLDPKKFHLLIIGGGDIFDKIEMLVLNKKLADRISLIPKIPFEMLHYLTQKAHLGLTLDKPTNINHIYGLPNKIFDYIHAELPVLSSRLIELEKIIATYDVGTFINNHEPEHIAETVKQIAENPEQLKRWKANTLKAKTAYNWESEEKKLLQIYDKVCKEYGLINGN